MASVLLDLPEHVLNCLHTEWTSIADLARMDAALCQQTIRETFLLASFGQDFHYNSDKIVDDLRRKPFVVDFEHPEAKRFFRRTKKFMQWAMHRRLTMSTICIAPYTNGDILKEWLIRTGRSVRRIIFVGDNNRPKLNKETERVVLRYCPNVTSVICSNQFDAPMYGKIAKAWPRLNDFTPWDPFSLECAIDFIEHCTSLTSLDVSCMYNDSLRAAACLVMQYGATLHEVRSGRALFDNIDLIPLVVGQSCPNLRVLDIGNTLKIPDYTLPALLQGCPHLQEVDLKGTRLSPEHNELLASTLGPHLLSFRNFGQGCGGPYVVESMARHCPNLRVLLSDNCVEVSDAVATLLAHNCLGLEELDLEGQCKATPHAILTIAASCKQLRTFNLDFSVLSETEMITMLTSCPHLTHLKLDHCQSVTDHVLQLLPQLCPQAGHLWLGSCQFGEVGLQAVVRGCRKLQFLQVPDEWAERAAKMVEVSGLFRPKLTVYYEGECRMGCAVM